MPEFILDGTHDPEYRKLDSFTQGYIQALFFTDIGQAGILSDMGFTDLDPATLARIVQDCAEFQEQNAGALDAAYEMEYDAERAGMDFWYTRNGHGCGYWDRDLDAYGVTLTDAANACGEVWSYLSDAGKVCLS